MFYLNLRMLCDVFLLSFEAKTHRYQIGPLLAETYNRALLQARRLCPEVRALDPLPVAVAWDTPQDLYLAVCMVCRVYVDYMQRSSEMLIGA